MPFVCGARNLGEALRRIGEGAAMIRTKGEPGTGNVVEAVRHMRTMLDEIAWVAGLREEQLFGGGQGPAGPVRAREVGPRERDAAGRELLGGRHRDAGRCGADDAARLRRRVRGQRHLQERRPVRRARRRSSRPRRTSTIPTSSPASRATSARRWWASTSPTFPTPSACRSGAGRGAGRRPRAAGRVPRAHTRSSRRSAPRPSPCACRTSSTGWTDSSSRVASRPLSPS